MPFFAALFLMIPLWVFSQDSLPTDSAALPDTLVKTADSVPAATADTSRPQEEETAGDEDEEETEVNADSMAALQTAYDLTGLSQHIGANGLTLFLSFVKQFYGDNTTLPGAHSFGAGFSGDVLTGLSFVHLIPSFHYWQYSEDVSTAFLVGQTYRDVGVAFHSALVTPRFTHRKARAFFGAGPSLHLTLLTQRLAGDQAITASAFKNGFSVLLGGELPLTGTFAFIATATYKQTYDWSRLDRQYLMVSLGLAM